ncbi:MAG: serine--tRNA ligase [Candidatus Latescibacteria bacterium]|nr:serine--tRNA ligase [Candidatus Latescibacterota bacterium]NIM22322.1 serine--tRNA ligase [Candidatus Latescibacterota bacterium]NIM66151.1 serine--tRNA ligase [Candidatus Latescibacterota bacterium]NIO02559.1 serine--tRNA ligase [Candidatus Latescibacterota bacterium]NIO29473.1 serine--tRNA ligase [Candidatus Latescibacterota bacterium]
MLDKRLIRDNPEAIRRAIETRGYTMDVDQIIALDKELLENLQAADKLKHERNVKSEEIGNRKRAGKSTKELHEHLKKISLEIKTLEAKDKNLSEKLNELLLLLPNIPHESVPVGNGPEDNVVVRIHGEIPEQFFDIAPHWEIGERIGVLDLEAGRKISGRGFIVFRKEGALLCRALVNLMLDTHREKGYEEVLIPYMVNRDAMIGTGQLPKLSDDMYLCEVDDLFLIPTSEVPITNIHRDTFIALEDLPLKHTAFSPCFRREAGSYGADTRGLLRVHQFDKVEIVKIVHPDTSYEELESLVLDASAILDALELPYRVVELCTADLGFAAAKCYDLEVYAPGIKKWLEVSSCSNFEAFQARRANIKLKKTPGEKHRFAHTLNGSGLALPRIIAAIFEFHQTPTGRVKIPKRLVPYMHGVEYLG